MSSKANTHKAYLGLITTIVLALIASVSVVLRADAEESETSDKLTQTLVEPVAEDGSDATTVETAEVVEVAEATTEPPPDTTTSQAPVVEDTTTTTTTTTTEPAAPVEAAAPVYPTAPTIVSDKLDYPPGGLVTLTGAGWYAGPDAAPVRVITNDDDFQSWIRNVEVPVALDGSIVDVFNLPSYFVANYRVTATQLLPDGTTIRAITTFTDANASVSPTQCANGGVGSTAVTCTDGWINGNLGSNKGHYVEGDSVPYRAVFNSLLDGATYTLTIEWDAMQGNKHALDYLTTYNRTVTSADPCTGAGTQCGTVSTSGILVDPQVGAIQLPGQVFTLFGGTITGVSGYSGLGTTDANGARSIVVTFTASTTKPVLAWGGHIATRADWGANNSAVSISGSPYHMRLQGFSCSNENNCSTGNQDLSLSAAAVIFPASLTIIKDAVPNIPTDFVFTATGAQVSNFSLDDDSDPTLSNTRTFSLTTIDSSTRVITETDPSGFFYALTGLSCVESGGTANTTTSLATSAVTIRAEEAEIITCTFTNSQTLQPPSLTNNIVKTNNANGDATFTDSESMPEPGGTVPFSVTITNPTSVAWTVVSLVDDHGTPGLTGDDISVAGGGISCPSTTVPAGGSLTCTFSYAVTGNAGLVHTNTITGVVSNAAGSSQPASDTSVVTLTDVASSISVVKTAGAAADGATLSIPEPGGSVTFTVVVANTSTVDDVLISNSSFTDAVGAGAAAPQAVDCNGATAGSGLSVSLAPGDSITCTFVRSVTGNAGDSETDTVTVTGSDNDGGSPSDSDDAVVNFTWRGRTPGYWKNHPSEWNDPYLPTTTTLAGAGFVAPPACLSLDIVKPTGIDTMMQALNYKGGSTLSGKAQILLRAAVAALLNEAEFGNDFPPYASTADLVFAVNATLATCDGSAYTTLATTLDNWNNGIH